MKKHNQKIGKLGQEIAKRSLIKRGFMIKEENIYFRCGEIDILAEKKNALYFIEVKTRTNTKFGYIEDSISDSKLEKMENSILLYVELHNVRQLYFIMVIFVYLDVLKNKAKLTFFEI